jgi:L-amino acid N-acyltransferase YncA
MGIGKSMVKQLEERLSSLGFESFVTSSETVNPNTKRFFPDLGFVQIGELAMHHGGEIFYLKHLV